MADFLWGNGGTRLTPEDVAAQRKYAQGLMSQGMDYSPVASPWQGAARVAQALLGGYEGGQADYASKQNADESSKVLAALLGGAGAAPAATAPATAAPVSAAPAAIPAGKEGFISSIMPAVLDASAKTGIDPRIIGAQAAIESGWGQHAPGNNLFGIKSHGQAGGNVLPTTEVVNGQPVRTSDSFRSYASPADSVGGYADFINTNPRYAALKSAQGLDAQAAALGASGYATDPSYGAKVASIARGLPDPGVTVAPPAQPAMVASSDDPAALPPNATPTQGFAIPGQPAAAPAAPARPAINPVIAQALTNRYIDPQTKAVASMLFKSQMDQQAKANDPLRALQIQEARTKLTPMDAPAKDADGNLVQRDALGKVTVLNPADKAPTSVSEYEYYKKSVPPDQKPMPYDTWATAKARAGAMSITNNLGGGSDKQVFDAMEKSADAARATAVGLTGLREARNAVQGGAFTGAGADTRLGLQKVGAALGLADSDKIVNTETFRAAIAPQIAATLKSTVGTANISNSDREFAEKAAGGNITLDEKSITRLLDIMERASTAQLTAHQKRLEAVYPDATKNPRERALFGVDMPAAPPMPAAPQSAPGIDPSALAEARRRGLIK